MNQKKKYKEYPRTPNHKCEFCEKPLYVRPHRLLANNNKAFCSQLCFHTFSKKEYSCKICGSGIPARLSRVTCSEECRKINSVLNHNNRKFAFDVNLSIDSKAARKCLINFRGNKCQICGYNKTEILQVHHILERSNGGSNMQENLIVLCPNCHVEIHKGITKIPKI